MSLTQLIFNKRKPKGFCWPGEYGGENAIALEIDAILSESPEFSATPTKNPVESGASVTDHVALQPVRLNLECVQSNTPVSLLKTVGGLLTGSLFSDPAHTAYEYIKQLYEEREPFDFVGGLDVYRNMVITSFRPVRDSRTGNVLQFSATLEQIIIVESEVVAVVSMAKSVDHTGKKKSNLGPQATQEATENAKKRGASLLLRGSRYFGVLR